MTDDRRYLRHIMDCMVRVERYTTGGREPFFSSTLIQDAVIRNLQTLSESTLRLSPSLKSANPSIDWRSIAGFRNVVVHNYLGIDLDIIWHIVERDLPTLKPQVAAILQQLGETP